ncbi:hypothetical protein F5Y16DRAFT_103100 [Xylariaceae sp. FL0255]|nr:hypothetical protein F5Y16DRAFT_103100 [Xylariaceae sp. FL0255]
MLHYHPDTTTPLNPNLASGSRDRKPNIDQDLYLDATAQLETRIGHVISEAEFNSFVESSKSCLSLEQAKIELERAEKDCNAKFDTTSFLCFFHGLNALFEPLGLIANALDTLCQVHPTFSLLWGSMKLLVNVAREVSSIPTIVIDGIKQLQTALPVYSRYKDFLSSRDQSGGLLRSLLVDIYVEYLIFCIHAKKLTTSHIGGNTWQIISKRENPFQNCLRIIRSKTAELHQLASLMTCIGVDGLHDKMDFLIGALSHSTLAHRKMPQTLVIAKGSTIADSGHRIIPGLLTSHFAGRDNELSWLEDRLKVVDGDVVGCCVGIHGMTGVGKTQLT